MITIGDENGNTIGNDNHIGNFSNDMDPDSHLVCNVLSISHVVYDTDCVGIGNFGDPTDLFNCDSDEGNSSSQFSYFQFCCWQYCKQYNVPSLSSHNPCTNKHK